MNHEPLPPVMSMEDELNRLRRERDRARKLLAVFVNISYGNRTPHSPECVCDQCEALHAARQELVQ
jgi:hypothetical protein